ncbi:hypothetical protein D3C81_752550 [compost metagenome]
MRGVDAVVIEMSFQIGNVNAAQIGYSALKRGRVAPDYGSVRRHDIADLDEERFFRRPDRGGIDAISVLLGDTHDEPLLPARHVDDRLPAYRSCAVARDIAVDNLAAVGQEFNLCHIVIRSRFNIAVVRIRFLFPDSVAEIDVEVQRLRIRYRTHIPAAC